MMDKRKIAAELVKLAKELNSSSKASDAILDILNSKQSGASRKRSVLNIVMGEDRRHNFSSEEVARAIISSIMLGEENLKILESVKELSILRTMNEEK